MAQNATRPYIGLHERHTELFRDPTEGERNDTRAVCARSDTACAVLELCRHQVIVGPVMFGIEDEVVSRVRILGECALVFGTGIYAEPVTLRHILLESD